MSSLVPLCRKSLALRLACLWAPALVACADPLGDPDVGSESAQAQVSSPSRPQGTSSAQPQLVTKVDAFGSGCPAGRWDSVIEVDRQAFTVFFEAYTISITRADLVKTLNCTVTVDVTVPAGISYAISTFGYDGPAVLAPGMEGRIETRYTFVGQAESPLYVHRITGPLEQVFTFLDEVPVAARTWSSCATYRQLQIRTQMILKNGTSPSDGEMSLAHLDGRSTGKLRVGLATKACPSSR